MNFRSIRFRLTLWHAGLMTLVYLVLGALTFFALQHYLEAGLRDTQFRRARQIADTLLVNISPTGEEAIASQVETLYAPEVNERFIRITRKDGKLIFCSGQPKEDSFEPSLVPLLGANHAVDSWRKEFLTDGKALLISAIICGATRTQSYLVEVGEPTRKIEAILHQVLLFLTLGLPEVLIVGIGGGYLLVQRALAQVVQLTQKAEQITQHNLSERLPVLKTGDELEGLSNSLNHMISRLEDAIQNSKRFLADASHELRTPLTLLRGELEHLTENLRFNMAERDTFGSMLEEVERLAKIVEGLVALSRLDAGEAQIQSVPFDLAELATTTADQLSLLAEDRGISISCQAVSSVIIQGDSARIKQVIVNLLDNAIKYTLDGGAIKVFVLRQENQAILEVSDNGIGIPGEDLPHVFERFFRVDKARTRDLGGAGLGLSIVKSICVAHGGEVVVESLQRKGSTFRVKLPLVAKPDGKAEIKIENELKK